MRLLLADRKHCVISQFRATFFVSPENAEAADSLPWQQKDPFDRPLIARAMSDPIYLVTRDEHIKLYDYPLIRF